MNKKTALILGATGLIGNELLTILLEKPEYNKVVALVRKPLGMTHSKLEEKVINFDHLNEDIFDRHIDDVYSCLGTTIKKAQSKEQMRTVDVLYPLTIAQLTKKIGAKQFLLVSSLNANAHSRIFYSKIKGELEEEIQKIGFESVSFFRPSLLLGKRKEFRLGEKSAEFLYSMLPFIFSGPLRPYKAIHSKTVAQAMFKVAQLKVDGVTIYPSNKIEELGAIIS